MVDVQILIYEGFDELDAIGPYEVLDTASTMGADIGVRLVTLEPTDAIEAGHGLRVEPHDTLSAPDVLVVPGGGWNDPAYDDAGEVVGARGAVERGDLLDTIAHLHSEGSTVASVCTGGMILAHAGLLDDRPATTHAGAIDDLSEFAAAVREERVVDSGTVLTAGGVTSGLDLSLHLVERIADEATAERVGTHVEYEYECRSAYRS